MALPPEYRARCTDTGCTWQVTTTDEEYRDHLANQHATRYAGHVVHRLNYT